MDTSFLITGNLCLLELTEVSTFLCYEGLTFPVNNDGSVYSVGRDWFLDIFQVSAPERCKTKEECLKSPGDGKKKTRIDFFLDTKTF